MRIKPTLIALAGGFALAGAPAFAVQDLDPEALAAIDGRFDTLAAEGVRPGYAVVIAQGGEIVFRSSSGVIDTESGEAFDADSPVRIASMTKPVTALAAMQLVEDGLIGLDDPIGDYLPMFAEMEVATSLDADENGDIPTRPAAAPITVRQLLTHTAGLGYIFDPETDLGRLHMENSLYGGEGDLMARMEQLAAMPLYAEPGQTWIYSYAQDVLGAVIESASGQPFEDYMETEIFEPLGMHDTGFFFEDVAFDEADMSPLYTHDEDGALVEVEQGNPDWPSGGGGLVSTGNDYIRFAMMLAAGGELDGTRLIEAETLATMFTPQVTQAQLNGGWGGVSYGFGLAVVLPPEEGQEPQGIPGDVSWGGYFDTDFVVSPSAGFAAVVMTQIQPGPHTPGPRTAEIFRPMVYGALDAE
jgi:CubicO group peptidase (beta-lactamase class C family)